MNILSILQIIIGLPLALFIPGYLLARILFKELEELEKVALGFVLSISLDILLGLFLGYNEYMKNLTGGITAMNLWIYLGSITIILVIVYILMFRKELSNLINHKPKDHHEHAGHKVHEHKDHHENKEHHEHKHSHTEHKQHHHTHKESDSENSVSKHQDHKSQD